MISLVISYFIFKTRIRLRGNMNRGAHLLDLVFGLVCCCWMGSVCGDKAQERERVHLCNFCHKGFNSLQILSQHKIWQHSGHVFACKGCGKKFRKSFCTSPCGARTTIEDIILNLKVWGEEERKRAVMASSRKRADILYPLKWKYIVSVFNKFVCLIFFYIGSHDFGSKRSINVVSNNHSIHLLY